VIRRHVERGSFFRVVSHLDADGLSAAGIIGKALIRLGAYFRVRIAQQVDEPLVRELVEEKAPIVVFTDMGGGYLDLIGEGLRSSEVVICDHHQPLSLSFPGVFHVNPHHFGFDGATDVSGAGVTYFLARALDPVNVDMAGAAIVGALGDMQDKEQRLKRLNEPIVHDAIGAGLIETTTDLLFYGRETRPVFEALAYTTDPFISGLSGEEDKCLGFFINLGIPVKAQDRWRTLSDLTEEEKRKVYSELTRYLASRGLSSSAMRLIGSVYTLKREERWTPLRDAREFTSLLNACGRMDKPGLGVVLSMGDRGEALKEAQAVYAEYRVQLAKCMNWLSQTPEKIQELKHVYAVRGEGVIPEKIVSAIASIAAGSGFFATDKPVLVVGVTSDGVAKVSARAKKSVVDAGLNLGSVMGETSAKLSGRGGGHDVAAGAQVPASRVEDLITFIDRRVGEVLAKRVAGG
jgi:RecJ-like exonuclease